VDARHAALIVARVLPSWLSSLVLAGLFAWIWLAPESFGWESMSGLQAVVYIEIITVYAVLFMLAGRDEPLAWLSVLPVALLVGVALLLRASTFVAVVVPLHLVMRVAGTWSDARTSQAVFRGFVLSVILMAVSWLIVGLWPLPELGWTSSSTPQRLWWEVPAWSGAKRIPFGLPAWAFLYFLFSALTEIAVALPAALRRLALTSSVGSA
jgi:hypothetical protein